MLSVTRIILLYISKYALKYRTKGIFSLYSITFFLHFSEAVFISFQRHIYCAHTYSNHTFYLSEFINNFVKSTATHSILLIQFLENILYYTQFYCIEKDMHKIEH